MTSVRLIGRLAALVMVISAVAALAAGVSALLGYQADPEGFLADIALIFGAFMVVLAVGAVATAWGLWRDARWAWEVTVIACAFTLLTGGLSIGDPRGPSDSVLLEASLLLVGVLLLGLLIARWNVRRSG